MNTTTTTKRTFKKKAPAPTPSGAPIRLSGTVQHLHFSSDTFSAGKLRGVDGVIGHASFRAPFAVQLDTPYTFEGAWADNPPYGAQFVVTRIVYDEGMSVAGLRHFLAVNPAFFGIGPVKANRIVELCADGNLGELLRTDASSLVRAGLTPAQIDTLRDEWVKIEGQASLFTWLSTFGLTQCQMTRVVEQYGANARVILENNPYVLISIYGWGFARTDEIAMKMGVAKDHPGRIRTCVIDILQQEAQSGHTWMDAEELLRKAETKLALDTLGQRAALHVVFGEMQNAVDGAVTHEKGKVALTTIYAAERLVWLTLRVLCETPVECLDDNRIAYIIDASQPPAGELNDGQVAALRAVLCNRVVTIAGQAGSGKSFLLAAIVNALAYLGYTPDDLALCAPTGRAAKRMSEAVGGELDAKTIHRMLGYSPANGDGDNAWAHNADNMMPARVVIIDECGMLDIPLAYRLCSAIDVEHTRVIMIGDASQLPPVGPGMLLRDVVSHALTPHVALTQSVRQAGLLKECCRKLLVGVCPPTVKMDAAMDAMASA